MSGMEWLEGTDIHRLSTNYWPYSVALYNTLTVLPNNLRSLSLSLNLQMQHATLITWSPLMAAVNGPTRTT